jgi:lipoprotein-releasing system permease protein
LNLPDFIAKRTLNSKAGQFSGSIHSIAVISVAIGLAIMLVSILIMGGFQKAIKEKVYSFAGHLQVTKYTLSNSFEESPISNRTEFYQNYNQYPYIKHVQSFAFKAGLLKTDESVEGVLLKGIGQDYDTSIFYPNIIEGKFPNRTTEKYSTEVIISQKIADLLLLELNETVLMYFVQNPPRYRQLEIVGIYQTGMEDFDDKLIIGDLRMIQRLNDWEPDQVGGYEIFLNNAEDELMAEEEIFSAVESDQYVNRVSQKYVQYFDWLQLLNQNVELFLGLILFVACFNMVAVIFILIMERTPMIGLLKAVGAKNSFIRNIFIYSGIRLTIKGLFWGNFIALGLCAIQYYFHLIPLDQDNYYMNFVPIEWNFTAIIGLNLMVLALIAVTLIIPTWLTSKMNPIKAIRFD